MNKFWPFLGRNPRPTNHVAAVFCLVCHHCCPQHFHLLPTMPLCGATIIICNKQNKRKQYKFSIKRIGPRSEIKNRSMTWRYFLKGFIMQKRSWRFKQRQRIFTMIVALQQSRKSRQKVKYMLRAVFFVVIHNKIVDPHYRLYSQKCALVWVDISFQNKTVWSCST